MFIMETMLKHNFDKILVALIIISIFFTGLGYSFIKSSLSVKGNLSFSEKLKSEINTTILGKDMLAYLDSTSSPYVTNASGINFGEAPSDTNGKGLYLLSSTTGDEYPIYYYRGAVDNNHVLFGGFCWKIVRTTEKGGTKLIYDGVPSNNQCNNTGEASQLSTTSSFNTNYTAFADIGYMYGTRYAYITWDDIPYIYGSDVSYSNGSYTLMDKSALNTIENINTKHYTCKLTTDSSCTKVYYVYRISSNKAYAIELTDGKKLNDFVNESYANEHDSTIKGVIDKWFASSLASQESKLEDAVWCNDRSIAFGGFVRDGYAIADTYFGGWAYRNMYSSTPKPAIKNEEACIRKDDRFTKSDTINGNGALTYPVGLLTADEATIAGNGKTGYSNNSYLYNGKNYWGMSPSGAVVSGIYSFGFYIESAGFLESAPLNFNFGVRPSIVLKNGIVATSGDGTATNPYVIA